MDQKYADKQPDRLPSEIIDDTPHPQDETASKRFNGRKTAASRLQQFFRTGTDLVSGHCICVLCWDGSRSFLALQTFI